MRTMNVLSSPDMKRDVWVSACTITLKRADEEKGGKKVKTDKRDARAIAQNLAYGTYSAVFVPTEEDLAVRDYIRMRNDHKAAVKRIKQQINALCMRHGYIYQRTNRTAEHLKYIKGMI